MPGAQPMKCPPPLLKVVTWDLMPTVRFFCQIYHRGCAEPPIILQFYDFPLRVCYSDTSMLAELSFFCNLQSSKFAVKLLPLSHSENYIKLTFVVVSHKTWRGGAMVKAFGLAINRSRVQILLEVTLRNNLGQVVYTYVPQSPSSITWYQPKGGDALKLGR